MPARVVGQIETESEVEQNAVDKTPIAYAWWLAFMLQFVIDGSVVTEHALHAAADRATLGVLTIVGNVVFSISFAMLVFTVRRISNGQDALYAAATNGAPS